MKNLIVKKITVVTATLLLTGSMGINVCAASAPTNKSTWKTTEAQTSNEKKQMNDAKNEVDEQKNQVDEQKNQKDEGEVPEESKELEESKVLEESKEPEEKELNDQEGMLDIAAAQNAIDAVTDEDLQDTLQDLLDAYTAALDAEKEGIEDSLSDDEMEELRQAVTDAGDALLDAMEDASISTDGIRKEGNKDEEKQTDASEAPEEKELNDQGGMLDIAAVQNAINAVTDEDLQDTLQDLLDAYTAALDAEKEGIEDSLSDDEMEELRQAVTDAGDALLDAMEDASISTDGIREQENIDEAADVSNNTPGNVSNSTSGNVSNSTTASKKVSNILKKAKTWLNNLFS